MLTSKEFVEFSISHQLGGHAGGEFSYAPEAFARAIAASSGMTLSLDHTATAPMDLNGWQPSKDPAKPWQAELDRRANAYKTIDALHSILEAGADFDFLVDMQDHRNREVVDPEGRAAPLLNFNRLHKRPKGQVLWPLPLYHDIGSREFLGKHDALFGLLRGDILARAMRQAYRAGRSDGFRYLRKLGSVLHEKNKPAAARFFEIAEQKGFHRLIKKWTPFYK